MDVSVAFHLLLWRQDPTREKERRSFQKNQITWTTRLVISCNERWLISLPQHGQFVPLLTRDPLLCPAIISLPSCLLSVAIQFVFSLIYTKPQQDSRCSQQC